MMPDLTTQWIVDGTAGNFWWGPYEYAAPAIMAAPLLLAVWAVTRRRSRARRGLCPSCAYPIGTSDVCTECGAAVETDGGEHEAAGER